MDSQLEKFNLDLHLLFKRNLKYINDFKKVRKEIKMFLKGPWQFL